MVFGSRFLGGEEKRVLFFWHSLANKILTLISNMCSDINLTDMETCYKVFKSSLIKKIELKENSSTYTTNTKTKSICASNSEDENIELNNNKLWLMDSYTLVVW